MEFYEINSAQPTIWHLNSVGLNPLARDYSLDRVGIGCHLQQSGQSFRPQDASAAGAAVPTHAVDAERVSGVGGAREQIDIPMLRYAGERGIPFNLAVLRGIRKLPVRRATLEILFYDFVCICDRDRRRSQRKEHQQQ